MSCLFKIASCALAFGLSGCGGSAGPTDGGDSRADAGNAACPPERKGDGLMVSQRYDLDDVVAAGQWREDIPPRSCAGELGALLPDFPDNYGLAPASKPYVMNNQQVHIAVGELPDPLVTENGVANYPSDHPVIQVELLRYTPEEMSKVRDWMLENPGSYRTYPINGTDTHLIGYEMALVRPGKTDRIAAGLIVLLDGNIVAKVSHPDLFKYDEGIFEPGSIVYRTMSDILNRS